MAKCEENRGERNIALAENVRAPAKKRGEEYDEAQAHEM